MTSKGIRHSYVPTKTGLKWPSITFLVLLLMASLLVIGIMIYTLITGDGKRCTINGQKNECPLKYIINKSIVSFSLLVFQGWFAIAGVFWGNRFEILGAYTSGFLLCAFAAWRLFGSGLMIFTDLVMFSGVLLVQFICSIILPFVLKEHNWRLYRKVGADPLIRTIYERFLTLICVLKILLLLSIINGTSSGVGLEDKSGVITLDVIHWVCQTLLTAFGWASTRHEWAPGIVIALMLSIYTPGYVIFWMIQIVETHQLYSDTYALKALAINFVASGSLTLIFQVIACSLLVIQWMSFGKGFKTVFESKKKSISAPYNDPYLSNISLFGTQPAEESDDGLSDLDFHGTRSGVYSARDSLTYTSHSNLIDTIGDTIGDTDDEEAFYQR